MIEQGRVLSVTDRPLATNLTNSTIIGATSITVDDPTDCDENGGQIIFDEGGANEEIATYSAPNDDTGVISTSALTKAHAAEETVAVYPKLADRIAMVQLLESEDESIDAQVPFEMKDRFAVGVRDPELQESVLVEEFAGDWWIKAVPGLDPLIDAEFIDPISFDVPPSDGLPPGSSPAPTVIGGLGSLFVQWTPITNSSGVTYEIHISTTTGFTPDATTKVGEEAGSSMFVIKKMPDGSDLAYGTVYYVKIVAKDVDGSASASAQASGQIVQVTGPDLAVESIIAAHIVGGSITADKLAAVLIIANAIKTGETGQRAEMTPLGITLYDPSGNVLVNLPTEGEPYFRGGIEAVALTVLQSLTLRGTGNILDNGAVITMRRAIQASQSKPTMALTWDKIAVTIPDAAEIYTATYDASGFGSQPTWLVLNLFKDPASGYNLLRLQEYKAADMSLLRSVTLGFGAAIGAAVRLGANIYIYTSFYGSNYLWKYRQSDFVKLATQGVAVNIEMQNNAALSTDGTDLFLAYMAPPDVNNRRALKVAKFNTSLVYQSTVTYTGKDYGYYCFVTGFVIVSTDRWVQFDKDVGNVFGTNKFNSAGAYQANNEFDVGTPGKGLTYDGTVFLQLVGSGNSQNIYKHSSWVWTTESGLYWVKYTWFKDNAPGGRGAEDYETLTSAANSILHKRRAKIRVTLPDFPATVTHAGIYMNRGASEPADNTFQHQYETATKSFDAGLFWAGAAPPTVSTFPLGTASALKSDDGTPLLRADGIPRLKVGKAGNTALASGVQTVITGWDAITVDTDAFWDSGNSRFIAQYTGQYLLILRGVFDASGAGTHRSLFAELSTNGGGAWGPLTDFRMPIGGLTLAARVFLVSTIELNANDLVRFSAQQNAGAFNISGVQLALILLGPK